MHNPRRIPRILVATVTLSLVLSTTREALADSRTEARRHFRRGMELVVEGRIDEGVAELEEAYEILPHPNVLYNIGRAFAEVGRYEEARDYFDRYLETDPPDREEVRAIVAAIDSRLATRAAAAAAATPTEPTTVEPTTVRVAAASDEQIAEMRATATQLREIATLSGSATLAARADELSRLADAMERAAVEASETTTETTTTTTTTTTATTEPTSEEPVLAVASANEEGTYEEQVVSSSRFAQSPLDAASATTIITRQDIRLTGIVVFEELLRRAAGVHVMAMSPGNLNVGIRGFNRTVAPRVVVLVNGRSTYLDALGVNFFAVQSIDVEDVERIEIIRGPASALYGANAFSGIINVITRTPGDEPGTDATLGAGNAHALRGRVATNGRVGSLAYRVSAGFNQADRYTRMYDPSERVDLSHPDVIDPDLGVREGHARLDLRYRLSQNARLEFEGGFSSLGAFSIWGVAGYTDTLVTGPTSHVMGSLQTNWGSIRAFWNRYDYNILQSDQHLPLSQMTGNTVDVEAVLAREFELGVPHNLHLGVGYRWKSIEWTTLDTDHTQNHYSLFFEDTLRLAEAVRLTAGFRTDLHPLIDKLIWSPRLALVLRPTDGQSVRLGATSSFRTMSFGESYAEFGVPTPIANAVGALAVGTRQGEDAYGSPALEPERIVTAEVGYLNQENSSFDFEVSAYYNRVWNMMEIGYDTAPYTIGDYANPALAPYTGFDPETNRFIAAASLIANDSVRYNVLGSELGVRAYPVEGLDLYANYSFNYTYANNQHPGLDRVDRRQPQNMMNAGVQYRLELGEHSGFDVAADFHVYSRTKWSEVVTTTSGIERALLPLDAFYLINARVGFRFLDDKLEVGVAATNVTNNRVRQHPFAQTGGTRVLASVTARF